ncbi:MAG: hypothetical protein LC737_05280 [Chloroflexi bacterium]|nr:hypothetical protein [Chloroflexota bacterium]
MFEDAPSAAEPPAELPYDSRRSQDLSDEELLDQLNPLNPSEPDASAIQRIWNTVLRTIQPRDESES